MIILIEELNLFNKENDIDKRLNFRDMLTSLNLKSYTPDSFGKALHNYTGTHGKKIKTLSLFSGAGGLDIGFEDAGFEIIEQNEIENDFANTLELNKSGCKKVVCKDIRKYNGKHLKGKVDFIVGGPPCQPFSSAARRAFGVNGTIDARGTLFNEYVRILKEVQPQGFLFENVYGIVSSNGGQDWTMIKSSFKNAGYTLHYKILNAADYGVPQHRSRLIIVGLKGNINYKFPLPTHGPDSPDKLSYFSAGKAIKGISCQGNNKELAVTGKYGYLLDNIPEGLNYSYYTSKVGNPISIFAWRSKFSDFLYKADHSQPVKTIKANGGQYTGPFHWNNRKFSIEELKRLQTFPDSYQISGSKTTQRKQIGNAVPPQFARFLALSIRDQVFQEPMPFRLNYMTEDYKLSFNKYKRELSKNYYEKAKFQLHNKDLNFVELKNHTNFVDLDSKLDFVIKKNKSQFEYQFIVGKDSIHISLRDRVPTANCCGKEIASLKIELSEAILNKYRYIDLKLYSQSKFAYTALWKALEYELSLNQIKGDLVQLNGYYQYPPKMHIKSKFSKDFIIDVKLMKQIMCNNITGGLQTLSEISDKAGISKSDVLKNLKLLKTIGYEVRNKNTNIQIHEGYWLIPYAFPTMSNLSIQMYKEL